MAFEPSRAAILLSLASLVFLHAAWQGESAIRPIQLGTDPSTKSARTAVKSTELIPESTIGILIPTSVSFPSIPNFVFQSAQLVHSEQATIELLFAFILLVVGVIWSTPALKDITWASEMRLRSVSLSVAPSLLGVRDKC